MIPKNNNLSRHFPDKRFLEAVNTMSTFENNLSQGTEKSTTCKNIRVQVRLPFKPNLNEKREKNYYSSKNMCSIKKIIFLFANPLYSTSIHHLNKQERQHLFFRHYPSLKKFNDDDEFIAILPLSSPLCQGILFLSSIFQGLLSATFLLIIGFYPLLIFSATFGQSLRCYIGCFDPPVCIMLLFSSIVVQITMRPYPHRTV